MKNLPYSEYRNSPLWKIIEKELSELEENKDLEITTMRDLVIGSLVKAVKESGLLKDN